MSDDKPAVAQAVDALLYAPIGFALEARRLLPTFVERGRAQVQMAKVIGQFAVKQGSVVAGQQLAKAQDLATGVLSGSPSQSNGASEPSSGPADPRAHAVPDRPAQTGPDAGALPISGYDSLAASQVIPRLEGLEPDELEAVRRYETDHRGRKTILGKISQLQGS